MRDRLCIGGMQGDFGCTGPIDQALDCGREVKTDHMYYNNQLFLEKMCVHYGWTQ